MSELPAQGWIGASLLRKEDARHLHGHGMFIADVRVPGHAGRRLRAQPDGACAGRATSSSRPDAAARVFTLADLRPAQHARGRTRACRPSAQPLSGRSPTSSVRYVGQTIAACVAPTRAQAEDLADQVTSNSTSCRRSSMCVAAMRPGSPRVFDAWPDNAYISTTVNEGDPTSLAVAPRSGCAASSG